MGITASGYPPPLLAPVIPCAAGQHSPARRLSLTAVYPTTPPFNLPAEMRDTSLNGSRHYARPMNGTYFYRTAIVVGCLAGCATEWRGSDTTIDSAGRTVCALHHIPLITERVFVFDGFWSEPEASARIRARYPSPWQAGFSSTRGSELPMRRTTLTYCQRCTNDYHAEIKRRGM
jgi:hypothetical protein